MKRILLIVAILVAAPVFVFSQSAEEQAVQKTLTEISAALNRNDADALEKFYAEGYTLVTPQGVMMNRAQRLASFRSGEMKFESFGYSDTKIRIYGNTAVINTNVTYKAGGQTLTPHPTTITMVKNGGRWQIVAAQGTPVSGSQTAMAAQGTPVSTSEATAIDETALNQFMDNYLAALVKNSADAVEPFLAAQYIRIGGDGSSLTKEQIVGALRSGDLKYASVVAAERTWRTFGNDTAIVTSLATIKATNKGQEMGGTYRATSVLRKVGDRWVMISTHLSPVAGK
jgi:ketosteroid isomerase-like protein